MTRHKPQHGLPEWLLYLTIAVLATGLIGIALYVWNNVQADTSDELGMITERVSRTNDRQIEMDRRITRLETILELKRGK